MKQQVVLGVDIGGSHITAALVDLDNNRILEKSRFRARINSGGPAPEIFDGWCEVMQKSLATAPHSGKIGIAMPGPFDYRAGISYMSGQGKYDGLYGLDVREALFQRMRPLVDEIRFVNDATCFLQGEARAGAAAGFDRVIGFTLGTGFGSATFNSGTAHDASYWQFPFLDGTCEDYFSTRWFVKRYAELSGFSVSNVKDITADGRAPEKVEALFGEFTSNMVRFLSAVLGKNPYDAVVFGGNISNAANFFLPSLQRQLGASVPVMISVLGENSALIGSASYYRVAEESQISD